MVSCLGSVFLRFPMRQKRLNATMLKHGSMFISQPTSGLFQSFNETSKPPVPQIDVTFEPQVFVPSGLNIGSSSASSDSSYSQFDMKT